MIVKPLTGHPSIETAYSVGDYPYGRLRCQIRYWLESDPKKGFRFVSQTENPKTLRWNAPKKSTYQALAGAMYLDEQGHCHWTGLHFGSNPDTVLQFIAEFPEANFSLLQPYVKHSLAHARLFVQRKASWYVNGVEQKASESQLEEYARDVTAWEKVCIQLMISV